MALVAAAAVAALPASLRADIAAAPAARASDLGRGPAVLRGEDPARARRPVLQVPQPRLADKIKGGLMLDTREGMLHGGDTGPAIAPGKPEDSLIVDAISYKDADLQMPPKGERLSDEQVADITEWIRQGAPDPRSLVAKGSSAAYGGVGRDHWSFLPVRRQAVPVGRRMPPGAGRPSTISSWRGSRRTRSSRTRRPTSTRSSAARPST